MKRKKVRGDILPSVEDPHKHWLELQEYPDERDLKDALRNIPKDLAEALEIQPAMFITATARLHGLMSHWTTRMAYAKGRLNAAKAAKEIGLEALKADRRRYLNRTMDKVTEGMISERAKATDEYARLCLLEIRAETDYMKIKGLVDSIVTKSKSQQTLSFVLKPEMDMAEDTYTVHPDLNTITHPSDKVETALADVRKKMKKRKKRLKTGKARHKGE